MDISFIWPYYRENKDPSSLFTNTVSSSSPSYRIQQLWCPYCKKAASLLWEKTMVMPKTVKYLLRPFHSNKYWVWEPQAWELTVETQQLFGACPTLKPPYVAQSEGLSTPQHLPCNVPIPIQFIEYRAKLKNSEAWYIYSIVAQPIKEPCKVARLHVPRSGACPTTSAVKHPPAGKFPSAF